MSSRKLDEKGLWNPYVAGAFLGLVLFGALFVTGSGLGGSGGSARVMAYVEDQVSAERVDRNPYLSKLAGGDRNPVDHPLVYQLAGVLIGGFLSGLLGGRVKPKTEKGPRISVPFRLAMALSGGVIVGWAARLARGCTSGQALSGGAVLSAGSWAFMFAVFAGAYLVAYPLRKLWN